MLARVMSMRLGTEPGARAGIIGITLGCAEIFSIPSFEISIQRFEMCNFPVGQCLGCVYIVVIMGRNGIPSSHFGNSVHHGDVPDSRHSIQVANRSSTDCLNHGFFLTKSLKKISNEKDWFCFPELPTISGNYCFLELKLSKQDTFRPQHGDYC